MTLNTVIPNSGSLGALTGSNGVVTAVAGAATINQPAGRVTSEALSTATTYGLTMTNDTILSTSTVLVNVTESTGAAVIALLSKVVTAGQVVIDVSMASLTGSLYFDFAVIN